MIARLRKKEHILTERELSMVFVLGGTGATNRELASTLKVPLTTLERNYGAAIKEARDKFRYTLRQELIKAAFGNPAQFDKEGNMTRAQEKRHPGVLIFLSKNLLGMSDNAGVDVNMGFKFKLTDA